MRYCYHSVDEGRWKSIDYSVWAESVCKEARRLVRSVPYWFHLDQQHRVCVWHTERIRAHVLHHDGEFVMHWIVLSLSRNLM